MPDSSARERAPSRRRETNTTRTWRAPDADNAPPDSLSPLERAGARAKALAVTDPELLRVRTLLADLRPDCADPYEPPEVLVEKPGPPVMIHDPTESHGGIPRGYGAGLGHIFTPSGVPLSDVLDEVGALGPDAGAVLRWLRDHGSLKEGLRGLFADLGQAFATEDQAWAWGLADDTPAPGVPWVERPPREPWRDLAARREGAPVHGRLLVLRAAAAWGR